MIVIGGDPGEPRLAPFEHLAVPAELSGATGFNRASSFAFIRAEHDLALRVTIAQGVEMGRPSLLEAEADKRGGEVVETRIGGRCIPVMRGRIDIG